MVPNVVVVGVQALRWRTRSELQVYPATNAYSQVATCTNMAVDSRHSRQPPVELPHRARRSSRPRHSLRSPGHSSSHPSTPTASTAVPTALPACPATRWPSCNRAEPSPCDGREGDTPACVLPCFSRMVDMGNGSGLSQAEQLRLQRW